jgi:methyl-accepting chemotaxis protein
MQQVEGVADCVDSEQLLAFAEAMLSGDFSARLAVGGEGAAADAARRLNFFAQHMERTISEVTRLSTELSEGVFGGQAESVVNLRRGPWRSCLEAFNEMEWALTGQIRNFANISARMAAGKTDKTVTVECKGEMVQFKNSINLLVERMKNQS